MFKKRIRVAQITFLTILVLTALVACLGLIFGKNGKGIGKLTVKAGSAEAAEGVTIQVGTVEMLWPDQDLRKDSQKQEIAYYYKTRTAEFTENKVVTALGYEKQTASEQRNRVFYWMLRPEFSKRFVQGSHKVKGNEFSYDLEWYLSDGYTTHSEAKYRIEDYVTLAEEDEFLYYYDGLGPNYYEAAPLTLENGRSYNGNYLCELDGNLYGYVGTEPQVEYRCRYYHSEDGSGGDASFSSASMSYSFFDFEKTCEKIENRDFAGELSKFGEPELHLTVRKGIYRFEEDGTAECVVELGEYGDGFPYLWIVANEKENTLTLIGEKEKRLFAHVYHLDTGKIEERELWNGADTPEVFEEWLYESVNGLKMADFITVEERSYLCCTAIYGSQVNLTVFEDGNRVFEGEVLQTGKGYDGFEGIDFLMSTNELIGAASVMDKVEIILTK